MANYKDLTTCKFNLLPLPPQPPPPPRPTHPSWTTCDLRFEISGSLTGSLKKKKWRQQEPINLMGSWRQAFKDIAVPRRKFPTLTALPRII